MNDKSAYEPNQPRLAEQASTEPTMLADPVQASRDRHPSNIRRSFPPTDWCPHCWTRPTNMVQHFRDTGDAIILPDGACPILFLRRQR